MVEIPRDNITQKDIADWYLLQQQLAKLKVAELLARARIFKGVFPDPKEGTNSADLSDGWVLKAKYPIIRDVDIASLSAMRPKFVEAKINADELIKWQADLKVAAYKTLNAEQMQLFDQCLKIKPGSASLEVVLPAKAKAITNQQQL